MRTCDEIVSIAGKTPSGKKLRKKVGKTVGVNGFALMSKVWKD